MAFFLRAGEGEGSRLGDLLLRAGGLLRGVRRVDVAPIFSGWLQRWLQLCYASHMAESPMELILEVRYAWH